ncbi:UNVERIFIED_CONTAM: Metal transporter Nramp1 [Sesamum radiatum]|uniref:Metal transporter Nramp1 n=1 Tax=Sesamum radiatum TaxID=300843 RepID=A0AAW2V2B0_SESRA
MAALVEIQETPTWKKALGYIGPGFLVSVAYLDPGNLETDLQAGADHKYQLLWIVLAGLGFALIIQSRSANLGVATGKHLSEHCKTEYPNPINYCLWLLAEIAVIAAEIPQVIGTAFAFNILFNVPIWSGVLLAGLNTLLLLGLQKYGIRKLEVAIGVLVLVVGGCFCSVMANAKPNVEEIMKGMFIPKLSTSSATRDAIALLGALIMPYKLCLQSASKYFLLESALALFIAFLINVAVISVTGSVCSNPNISTENKNHCQNITLNSAAFLLKNALGNWSSKLYAVSLLASGQSSTVTGTYAGQYIMQGFLEFNMKLWLRNLLTRCIVIAPSLVACIIGGPSAASKLIIIASMILSFELPFALVPLLKFTSSEAKMGQHKNSKMVTLILWTLGFGSIGINMYFLGSSLLGWLTSNRMSKAAAISAAMLILPVIILYITMLLYLTFKPETPTTNPLECILSSGGSSGGDSTRDRENNDIQRDTEIQLEDI